MFNEKGQSLIELIVSLTIAILVLGSLTFAILTSLRNAQFAKNQAQATKLAQEGLEKVRSLRDRDGSVYYPYGPPLEIIIADNFNDLWNTTHSCSSGDTSCFFYLDPNNGVLTWGTLTTDVSGGFRRQILLEDEDDGTKKKKVTAIVTWGDASGEHESRLTTILRRID